MKITKLETWILSYSLSHLQKELSFLIYFFSHLYLSSSQWYLKHWITFISDSVDGPTYTLPHKEIESEQTTLTLAFQHQTQTEESICFSFSYNRSSCIQVFLLRHSLCNFHLEFTRNTTSLSWNIDMLSRFISTH